MGEGRGESGNLFRLPQTTQTVHIYIIFRGGWGRGGTGIVMPRCSFSRRLFGPQCGSSRVPAGINENAAACGRASVWELLMTGCTVHAGRMACKGEWCRSAAVDDAEEEESGGEAAGRGGAAGNQPQQPEAAARRGAPAAARWR